MKNISKEIRKNSFHLSRKGKIISIVEHMVPTGFLFYLWYLLNCYMFHDHAILFFSVLSVCLGAAIGLIMQSIHATSLFIWRFFPADIENIKKYFQYQEKIIKDKISSSNENIIVCRKMAEDKAHLYEEEIVKLEVKLQALHLSQEQVLVEVILS